MTDGSPLIPTPHIRSFVCVLLFLSLPRPCGAILPETPDRPVLKDPFKKASQQTREIPDPLEPVNRVFFTANKIYYLYMLKPVSNRYRSATNPWTRNRVQQFFQNLLEPVTVLNGLLQGESRDATTAAKRFVINTTFGLGGLFDPARHNHRRVVRGFDQTFAKWGIDHGIYLHWPIVGPSSPRTTGGLILEEAMNPFWWARSWRITAGGVSLETVNWAAGPGSGYEHMIRHSIDGYSAMKNIFEQTTHNRAQQ